MRSPLKSILDDNEQETLRSCDLKRLFTLIEDALKSGDSTERRAALGEMLAMRRTAEAVWRYAQNDLLIINFERRCVVPLDKAWYGGDP